jgi:single-stranded DNA-binding protein
MPDASVSFAGNLTDDPELRHTEGGIARATLRVAVSGRREQEPSFFTVVVWRDQAEHAAKSLTKGSRVVVVGPLQQRRRRQRRRGRQRRRFDLFRGPHATTLGLGWRPGTRSGGPTGPGLQFRKPAAQQAELVALRILEDVPRLLTGLAHVRRAGTQ